MVSCAAWGWVEPGWGTFNFNAEWQGAIPGMSKDLRESMALKSQLDLDKCKARGHDSPPPLVVAATVPGDKHGPIMTREHRSIL